MVAHHDPRVNWELGWKAIQDEVKSIIKLRDNVERGRLFLEDQLFDLRMEMGLNPGLDQINHLKELEVEVRGRERLLDHLWLICNRTMWVKLGDAPN